MAEVIRQLGEFCDQVKPDLIVGIESRGFIFGAPLASDRRLGFVPVRKPGKLPGEVVGLDYALEYGTDRLEIQADAFENSSRVLVVDDLLATGGTAAATGQAGGAGRRLPGGLCLRDRAGGARRPSGLARRPTRGSVVALRLTVLPVEDVFQLLQTQQPEAPQHDREWGLFQFRLALPQFQGAGTQPQTPLKKLQQGVCCWGLPLAGHHHGRDPRLAQFGKARQSCMGPSLMARRLSWRSPENCFSSSSAKRRRGSNSGWRLENTRTRRSVATPTWSTSSQRLVP